MKNRKILLLVALIALSTNSCAIAKQLIGAAASGGDCGTYSKSFQAAKQQQGQLLTTIPSNGPYSMAMVLSQDAVNSFLGKVASFNKSVNVGIAKITFQMPKLIVGMTPSELAKYPTSSWLNSETPEQRGQRFYTEVGLTASIPLVGDVGGKFLLSVPVVSDVIGQEKTEVWARLSKAELVYSEVTRNGKAYTSNPLAIQAINTARDLFFKEQLKDYELFELKSWKIGNNDVRLIAGGAPDIDPVNHTLTFGMFTNLLQGSNYSIQWNKNAPQKADIGLHIHPELIRRMIGRMMTEGSVSDKIDMNDESSNASMTSVAGQSATPASPAAAPASPAQPQSSGDEVVDAPNARPANRLPSDDDAPVATNAPSSSPTFGVTLQEFPEDKYPKNDFFNLGFRLWRTGGGFCGYSDILAGFNMSIDENQFHFSVDPNSIRSVGASGSGVLASMALDSLTKTSFFKQALSVANATINFNEIELTDRKTNAQGKASLEAASYQLKVDGNGISVYLNLK